MIKMLLTGAAACALVFSAAAANPAEKSAPKPTYKQTAAAEAIDPIAVTTKEDAALLAVRQFAAADLNADNSIDAEEFAAFVAASAQARAGLPGAPDENSAPADAAFKTIAKGDMMIAKEELVEARVESFEKADADGDKSLDALEQQRFAALVSAKPQ